LAIKTKRQLEKKLFNRPLIKILVVIHYSRFNTLFFPHLNQKPITKRSTPEENKTAEIFVIGFWFK